MSSSSPSANAPAEKGTIVLAAGGSGGHMFPAQALAQELNRRGYDLVLITDDRGNRYADRFPNTEIKVIHAATFAGFNPVKRLAALFRIFGGVASAITMLGAIKPRAAIGFGGYSSFPTMVAASVRGIPSCLHDPNAVLGRVNKFLAGRVDIVGAGFDNMEKVPPSAKGKLRVIGNPLRDEVIEFLEVPYVAPTPDGGINLLIFGGSQGAQILGETVPAAIAQLPDELRSRFHVTQQAREENQAAAKSAYDAMGVKADVAPFFADLPQRMAQSHLVIGRAGASTVTELAALGRPSILVPLPSAMDDHQTVNARALTDVGAAWLMPQSDLTVEAMADKLRSLLCDPKVLAAAATAARTAGRPNATSDFADLIEELIAKQA